MMLRTASFLKREVDASGGTRNSDHFGLHPQVNTTQKFQLSPVQEPAFNLTATQQAG